MKKILQTRFVLVYIVIFLLALSSCIDLKNLSNNQDNPQTENTLCESTADSTSTLTPKLNNGVYEISTENELAWINNNKLDASYILKNDITLTCNNWSPIGTESKRFTGTFDGLGHTISQLKIQSSQNYQGLFGYIEKATIQNLIIDHAGIQGQDYVGALVGYADHSSVTNVAMKSSASSLVMGNEHTGGLIGYVANNSTIYGYATGAVKNSVASVGGMVGSILNSTIYGYATGAITGVREVGGLVGYVYTSTVRGYSTGAVTGTGANTGYIGGLVGEVWRSTISGYTTGLVSATSNSVGGLAGYITESRLIGYARGKVTSTSSSYSNFGTSHNNILLRSYYSLNESIDSTVTTTNVLATQPIAMNGQTGSSLFLNLDFGTDIGQFTWVADGSWPAINIGTFKIATEQPISRKGDVFIPCFTDSPNRPTWNAGEFEITTENEFSWIPNCLDGSYTLKNDIVLTSTNWTPIGSATAKFTGKFDGKGFTISQLKIQSTQNNQGFFGYIENATIENLIIDHAGIQGKDHIGAVIGNATKSSIKNVSSKSSNSAVIRGNDFIGGLVGVADYSTSISGYSTSEVNGNNYVGGLVGMLFVSSVLNTISAMSSGYATGAVSGNNYIGGLVGYASTATINGAYATGAVSGTGEGVGGLVGYVDLSTINGYATGTVTGIKNVGGLVGYLTSLSTDSIQNSILNGYATGAVSGNENVGGLVGGLSSKSSATGYARGRVTRSSGTLKSFGLLAGAGDGTVSGYHSTASSSFVGIQITDRTGTDGTAITMGTGITQTDFSRFTFNTDIGNWTWVTATNGRWPAINIGDFDTLFGTAVNGDDPSEQPTN